MKNAIILDLGTDFKSLTAKELGLYDSLKDHPLPSIGSESEEVLINWYEKNLMKPTPTKFNLNRLVESTGLTKNIIRRWINIVKNVSKSKLNDI